MANAIDSFRGEYRFLSNFYPCTVMLDGTEYPTVEHAYQASKTLDPKIRQRIKEAATPGKAKRIGKGLELQMSIPAWNAIKIRVMYDLLKQKFSDPVLGNKLIGTGDAELTEGNWWNDTFWGKCNGVGDNRLGILLEIVREGLKKGGETNG